MKKMFKRTAAIAVSAFMAAQYIPFTTIAQSSTTCDLYIHPYILSTTNYNDAKANNVPTGNATDVSQLTGYATSQAALTFDIYSVNASGVVQGNKIATISSTASAPATQLDLPDGYYKIVPTNTETDSNFSGAEATYIQLPVPQTGGGNLREVHIFPKYTDNNNTDPVNSGDPEVPVDDNDTHNITLIKSDSDDATVKLKGAVYKVYFKNAMGNWEAASGTYTTNAQGKICITGLPIGKYYFVEQTAPSKTDGNAKNYLLDKEPIAFEINGTTKPTDLDVTNDSELTVSKEISGDGKGENYNWTITAEIPADYKNLVSYQIKDEYDSNIVLNRTHPTDTNAEDADANAVIVKQGETELTRGTHYTAAITAANGNARAYITVTITPAGLNALTSGTDLTVIVRSLADSEYQSGTLISNKASIDYQYAYDPDKDPEADGIDDPNDDTDDDDPDKDDIITADNIPNPDPTDPDPNDPNNPPINSYPPEGDPDVEATFTPATITISNVSSDDTDTPKTELTGASYNITGCSVHNDDGNGVVVLANIAPGEYLITQTAVDSNHILNNVAKTIYIDTDGKVYEGDTVDQDKLLGTINATVVFENTPRTAGFNLPFTGTTATIVFTITGILLMAGTGFLIFILIKKRDDDDEDEEQVNN